MPTRRVNEQTYDEFAVVAAEPIPVDIGASSISASVAARTPTTTSVASSTSSVLLLAANANRKGVSIYNESTAILRISHSNPATNNNHFATLQPGGFYGEDQQAYTTGAICGIWSAANGTAQVRELV